MSKEKRISAKEFENAFKEKFITKKNIEWNGLSIEVKYFLDTEDVDKFVNICSNSCFNETTGEYLPEKRDFIIRKCIIDFYTNVTLPKNLSIQYRYLRISGIVEEIYSVINKDQIGFIINSIDNKIDYIKNSNTKALMERFDSVIAKMESLQEQFSDIFKNIEPSDVGALVSMFIDGGIDEKKLAKAYIETKNE